MTLGPVPFLDLGTVHRPLVGDLREAFERVLRGGSFILGAEVEAFESSCALKLEVDHAVGVSSGTDALLATLLALGVGPGDEVITTPFTFVSTAEVILRVGATVVFADIDPISLCLDPESVEMLLTERTRAVIGVHLYGQPALARSLANLCAIHGVAYVEDACQAFGARAGTSWAGTLGTAGCFSFFPAKPFGGFGDGGLVVTRDADLAERIRRIRVHGATARACHGMLGGNFRLDALQAALLQVKLPHVATWQAERERLASRYREALACHPHLSPPMLREPDLCHVYAVYTLRVPDRRDDLMGYLRAREIESAIYYPSLLADQPLFAGRCRMSELAEARRASREVLSIPLYHGLEDTTQGRIIDALLQWSP